MRTSRTSAIRALVLPLLVLAAASGCGERTGQSTTTAAEPTQVADTPPLPEWAPENPSPEFLRAARVLKPMPPEMFAAPRRPAAETEARLARHRRIWPAVYELFGTLSDEQMDRFLSTKEVWIPVKSLTTKQRAAFDNWLEVHHTVMEGTQPQEIQFTEDYRVFLYKKGAAEDLSNVEVGFDAANFAGGHAVHVCLRVRKSDGTETGFGSQFAVID